MAGPKKILLLNWRDPGHPEAGGAETYLFEIFKRLAKKGCEIQWVSPAFRGAEREEELEGIKIKRLGGPASFFPFNLFFYYQKFLKKENFDLVVDSISKLPLLTPYYIKQPLLGIFYQFHRGIFFQEFFWPVALFCYFWEALIPFIYRQQKIVVISPSTQKELIKSGFLDKNIFLVFPAIIPEEYFFDLAQKTKNPTAIYLGRLKKYKGLTNLLKAWVLVLKEFSQARLAIVGRGSDLKRLKRLVQKMDLKGKVTFYGFLSHLEKNQLLAKMWLMAFPSSKEGFGITVLEANASGVPVVGYRVSGLEDVIQEGQTGFLVSKGQVAGLAGAMKKIFADEAKRREMSFEARRFSGKFSWAKSSELMGKIIEGMPGKNV